MNPRTLWTLRRYGPFVGIALAFLLVVTLTPSKSPDRTNAFAGPGAGTGTGAATDPTQTAVGVGAGGADPAAGATAPAGDPAAAPGTPGAAGAAPGGAGAPAGGPGGAPVPNGVTGEDCARKALLGEQMGCMPIWQGQNGGATYRGVTGDEIVMVVHVAKSDPVISQALATQGLDSSPEQVTKAIQTYASWLSKHFQTYGRKVKVIEFKSKADAFDAAAQRAEAVQIAEELGAFMSIGAGSTDMADELARRGVICMACGAQNPASFYTSREPFVYGLLPDGDTTNKHISEYVCKRMGPGSTADHGGEGTKGLPRKYGILYPQEYYGENAEQLKALLGRCGIPVEVMIGYVSDIDTGAQQATNAITQLKVKGVTTPLCVCDPVAPAFLTIAATQQRYFPEWFSTGYFLQDADAAARFYDQEQWRRSFGISVLGAPQRVEDQDYKQVYRAEAGGDAPPAGALIWPAMLIGYAGLEAAGPALDPRTLQTGMFSRDIVTTNKHEVTIGWGPGDYGGIDDAREVWWNPDINGPDGKKGTYVGVNDHRRWMPGQWPSMRNGAVFRMECTARGSCGEPA